MPYNSSQTQERRHLQGALLYTVYINNCLFLYPYYATFIHVFKHHEMKAYVWSHALLTFTTGHAHMSGSNSSAADSRAILDVTVESKHAC
jgi:hypothetical protein